MSVWDTYPHTYRHKAVQYILSAVQAGNCVSVIGLSGAGKSNLMRFIAHRLDAFPHPTVLVDCNRLRKNSTDAVLRLIRGSLGDTEPVADEWTALDITLYRRLAGNGGSLCLLLDRFEFLTEVTHPGAFGNLRALRDTYKYQLTYVTATRRPLDSRTELAELFYAHTFWLGPLDKPDVRWNVAQYAQREGLVWGEEVAEKMLELSWGYPSMLRAVSEAYATGARLELTELQEHPVIRKRVAEFWNDNPLESDIQNSGLEGHPLLGWEGNVEDFDPSQLTAKEMLLLEYLRSRPGEVCTKDDLIRAVWPEDQIFERGIRDDSLAQLVRRLRVKIEPDPSTPSFIHTVPGRGYRLTEKD
jgi:energy-coupling factor transporter ATP-binding protein EcfA2